MSGAWNERKVKIFKKAFSDFLKHVVISSKETGEGPIKLYGAQKLLLNEIFDGLSQDIHFFVCLKGRQLGCSTIVRALIVFWNFMHPGLRTALVFDTDSNKNDARAEIEQFLSALPESHRIGVKSHNRDHLELENGSRISYFVAGIKKTKGSGGLGRSRGINCCGATEISSWGDIEGLRAFERSLAQQFPDRLYIFESTARGFNILYEMWEEAKADDLTKKAIFLGWWAKEIYSIPKDTPLYERYGVQPPDPDEQRKIKIVKERYGHEITMEQLAWYRHETDPNVEAKSGDAEAVEEIMLQELPYFEDEAFLLSGSQFFPSEKLTEAARLAVKYPVKGYRYFMSEEFFSTVLEQVNVVKKAQLKIWEEPDPTGIYAVGADPAYGSSEDADRFCIEVLRCYADGVDQVAEFCTPMLTTYQFAWIISHICGAYSNARLLLELNGPGNAVWNEFRTLETLLKTGYLRDVAIEHGLQNIFANVRQYLWSRQDSLKRNPTAFHWETTTKRKVLVMERLRDFFHVGQLRIRSLDALEEMRKIVRNGDSIHGDGQSKDDRVMALALAVRAWEDSERKKLIVQGRTRELEERRKSLTHQDLQQIFSQSLVQDFFAKQKRDRIAQVYAARRGNRWNW